MKSIQLTRDHKVKLLEMCNKLFPEYCKFEFFTDELRFLAFENDKYLTFIHWFEFCLLHLSEKIYKTFFKLGEKDNWYGCHLSWAINSMYTQNTNKVHLVDYLYEEFKKLK
jgi:hypothetical protein